MTIKSGLEVFLTEKGHAYREMKLGLVTHPAAVLSDLTHSLDALLSSGFKITALFGPEHGFYGFEADALAVDHQVDPRTGLPVYSLYGGQFKPGKGMLSGIDALVFDMQDVGARFYTFISTLYYVMKSAGEFGKRVLVLDRPNPLTGFVWSGPMLEEDYRSFVGILPMPVLHGMTIGEMARWINSFCDLGVELDIIRMQGWTRSMWYDETGLTWVPTSPGMPQFSTAMVYPCTCFFEGTNLSEGRGTPLPFEQVGAPWLDAYQYAAVLNGLNLPGVRFRATAFIPNESKHTGILCQGVQVHIQKRGCFQPFVTMLHMMDILIRHYAGDLKFLETSWEGTHPHFDLLAGSSHIRELLLAGCSIDEIAAGWETARDNFAHQRSPFLLYV